METQNKIRKREIEICQHWPYFAKKVLKNSNSDGSMSCAKKLHKYSLFTMLETVFHFDPNFKVE